MNLRIDKKHGDRFIYERTLIDADFDDLVKSLAGQHLWYEITSCAGYLTVHGESMLVRSTARDSRPVRPVNYRVYEYETDFVAIPAQVYIDALKDNPLYAALTHFDSVSDLAGYQCYRYTDTECYYAISAIGEVTGIINNTTGYGRITGFVKKALDHAILHRGVWLSCWDTNSNIPGYKPTFGKLPQLYRDAGWVCYDRVEYDVEQYGLPSVALIEAWQAYGEWEPRERLPIVRYFGRRENSIEWTEGIQ